MAEHSKELKSLNSIFTAMKAQKLMAACWPEFREAIDHFQRIERCGCVPPGRMLTVDRHYMTCLQADERERWQREHYPEQLKQPCDYKQCKAMPGEVCRNHRGYPMSVPHVGTRT